MCFYVIDAAVSTRWSHIPCVSSYGDIKWLWKEMCLLLFDNLEEVYLSQGLQKISKVLRNIIRFAWYRIATSKCVIPFKYEPVWFSKTVYWISQCSQCCAQKTANHIGQRVFDSELKAEKSPECLYGKSHDLQCSIQNLQIC